MSQAKAQVQAMLCLVVAMALWGSSFIALKLAFSELPPLWVIFARMALGSLVFLLAWRWRGRLDYRAGDWKYLLGLAVCEPCLYFVFEAMALQNTSAAQAGMITALLPLLVAMDSTYKGGLQPTLRFVAIAIQVELKTDSAQIQFPVF